MKRIYISPWIVPVAFILVVSCFVIWVNDPKDKKTVTKPKIVEAQEVGWCEMLSDVVPITAKGNTIGFGIGKVRIRIGDQSERNAYVHTTPFPGWKKGDEVYIISTDDFSYDPVVTVPPSTTYIVANHRRKPASQ